MVVKVVKRIRNRGCLPYLQGEGDILKPIQVQGDFTAGGKWYRGLTPFQRLHSHHTLASVRRYAFYKPHSGIIPKDDLDFVLNTTYDHSYETFPDPVDVILQPETQGIESGRRLRNTRDILPERTARGIEKIELVTSSLIVKKGYLICSTKTKPNERYNHAHPVLIGGVPERRHPHNIKLMNSSHHSPQTNAGYTRQDGDGSLFQY